MSKKNKQQVKDFADLQKLRLDLQLELQRLTRQHVPVEAKLSGSLVIKSGVLIPRHAAELVLEKLRERKP